MRGGKVAAPARAVLDAAMLRRAEAHLRAADPVLARIVDVVGPAPLRIDRSPAFAALVESIVYQQISGKAAAAIHARLCAALGRRIPRPRDVTAASDEALRAAGLSRVKIAYLRDLAVRAVSGLPLRSLSRLDDEQVVEALVQVKGIGRWTAEMFLMFRLLRPDVLPVGDYGIQKAMQREYRLRKLPKPAVMQRIAAPWRPYRSVACWYLWRSLDSPAGRA
jgi:3-methyladenine DNA glycosylase/8-oxoguanine DNA glycosylase